MPRCPWATTEPAITYHDKEWGVPLHDDRALFEREIARLQSENAALKRILLAHNLALPPGAMPEAPSAQTPQSLHLPSDAEIDRMVAFVGRLWQRFVDAVARAQKQVFNKS